MINSKLVTLGNAIRLMVLTGCVAFFVVVVQSCQPIKTDIDLYAQKTLKRLTQLEAPPPQPTTTFETFDGQTMQLSDYRGKVVLLNVWATWCAPCLKEMPSLSDLQTLRGSDQFEVVTISLDRTAVEAADWLADKDITNLTPWHDKSYSLNTAVEAPGLPITIIYNPQGREIARLAGDAEWNGKEALALVDYLMLK
ncbi:MAG: TlpA disulfide reductase family protein [Maricaulaceae bacterium]